MSYRFPNVAPWISGDYVWFSIQVRKIDTQPAVFTGSKNIVLTSDIIETYEFLAPQQLTENIGHDWQPYETIGSRIGDVGAKYYNTVKQATEHASGPINGIVDWLSSLTKTQKEGSTTTSNNNYSPNVTPNTIAKVDTPLVYTDTRRREYTWSFEMMAYTGSTGIVECVKSLINFSCTKFNPSTITMDIPYVFMITTKPSGFFTIGPAALTAVQPNYIAPYNINNNAVEPTKCELSLTFTELKPLYKDDVTLKETSSVTVVSTLENTSAGNTTGTDITAILNADSYYRDTYKNISANDYNTLSAFKKSLGWATDVYNAVLYAANYLSTATTIINAIKSGNWYVVTRTALGFLPLGNSAEVVAVFDNVVNKVNVIKMIYGDVKAGKLANILNGNYISALTSVTSPNEIASIINKVANWAATNKVDPDDTEAYNRKINEAAGMI